MPSLAIFTRMRRTSSPICWPGFREPRSISLSNSVRMSSSLPSSPKAPHSVFTHMRPSSPSTRSMWRSSSM
ncbi:hypothetical protein EYF80_037155 [Liparis tanakae]|uniref:Uncharacterized protein n=1 Tax=Liparis tanakae TaxID=230148 RepID=A0A4Z2GHK9_9TELE|nr:hypothetical protein EYF80_037155 [Liparis tanakae]